jgi:hypothetical protein
MMRTNVRVHLGRHMRLTGASFRPMSWLPSSQGAVAQLVVASVSKTEGPRFESWLPRSPRRLARAGRGNDPPVGVAAYVLFFVAGIGFGYAASGRWKWLPIVFPLALAIGAAAQEGIDGTMVARLIVALLVTVGGLLLGALLDSRGGRGERARYA